MALTSGAAPPSGGGLAAVPVGVFLDDPVLVVEGVEIAARTVDWVAVIVRADDAGWSSL